VIRGHHDERVVTRIAVIVRATREIQRHLDRAIELDGVPGRPLRVDRMRSLVDGRPLHHQIEAGRRMRDEGAQRQTGQVFQHRRVAILGAGFPGQFIAVSAGADLVERHGQMRRVKEPEQ
jgi:hypothetical protein